MSSAFPELTAEYVDTRIVNTLFPDVANYEDGRLLVSVPVSSVRSARAGYWHKLAWLRPWKHARGTVHATA
jgi:hypothetical protein